MTAHRRAVVWAITLMLLSSTSGAWAGGLALGDPAPAFVLGDLASQPVALEAVIGRGPVVLSFFATWCPGCQKEYPELLGLARDPELASVTVLGIDLREDADTVASFIASVGAAFPLLLDHDGLVTTRVYKIKSIPALVVIDQSGKIVMISGAMSAAELKPRLLELMPGVHSTDPVFQRRAALRRRFTDLHEPSP
jgi:peroxiredoxin